MRRVRRIAVAGLIGVAATVATASAAPALVPAVVPLTSRASSDPHAEALARSNFGLLQHSFPALASSPADASATVGAAPGTVVRSYPADNIARIDGPGGKAVVIATRPLRVLDAHGRSLPVDLTLQRAADGTLAPRAAPFSLTLAADPSGGFSLGPDPAHALHVTPLSDAPDPAANLQRNEVFAAGTHQQGDTLLRPTTTGLETYEQLRGPVAPAVFAWRLNLGPGQRVALVGGVLTVTQDGQPIVAVPKPAAFDADRTLVPTTVSLTDDVLSVTVSRRAGVSYPVIVDPDWQSTYDWSITPSAFGTEGWSQDANPDPLYDTFILTAPATVQTHEGPAQVDAGITILPVSGTRQPFETGDEAGLTWQSPGTTRIVQAHFRDVHEINDSARQTSRVGLFEGTPDGSEEVDDFFAIDHVNDVPDIPLVDPGSARFAVVQMFTPPCSDTGTPPDDCREIPSGNRTIMHVGSVDLTLTDDDLPRAQAAGPVRNLAGTWSAPTGTQTVNGSFADDGSGVESTVLNATGPGSAVPGVHIAVRDCDSSHTVPNHGSNICPASVGQDFDVNMGALPEGQVHFDLGATDLAGNASDASTGDSWDVFIDRPAPTIAAGGPLHDAAGTWVDPADIAAGTRLTAADTRSGVATVSLDATDETGAQVVHDTTDTCQSRGPIDAPCPTQVPVNVPIDPDALPEGRLDLTASATDFAGNHAAPQSWSLHLDRTRPAARAEGDLVALQDQWTNRTAPIDVTVSGRDAGSGVKLLRLVAVNADGRSVVKQIDTCGAADQDPGDGSCPRRVTRTVTVDPSELPDGKSTFEVEAVDLTGHASSPDQSWDTYIDHTPPPTPTGLVVTAKSIDNAAISWNRVVDSPDGSPAVSYQYLVKSGTETVVNWTTTPYPAAVVPGLPPGVPIDVLVRAQDTSGNLSPPAEDDNVAFLDPSSCKARTVCTARNSGPTQDQLRLLAEAHQPVLREDLTDGFPLQRFGAVFDYRAGGQATCIRPGDCSSLEQHPLTAHALLANGGVGQHLDYPAGFDESAQHDLYVAALQDKKANPRMYYIVVGDGSGGYRISYWFFYSYNYFIATQDKPQCLLPFLPCRKEQHPIDQHEGDWEHVVIYVGSNGFETGELFFRHSFCSAIGAHQVCGTGAPLQGDSRDIRRDSLGHLLVYAAHGSHASLPHCGLFTVQAFGQRDRACSPDPYTDDTSGLTRSFAEATRLDKLKSNGWACWQGQLGSSDHGPLGVEAIVGLGAAPKAPLAQEHFCSGQVASARKAHAAARELPSGLMLVDDVYAGIDKCGDWERPADTPGFQMVVCDQALLDSYFANGANPQISRPLAIEHPASDPGAGAPEGVPPVIREGSSGALDADSFSSDHSTKTDVYVSQTSVNGAVTEARFPRVALAPNAGLRVRASDQRRWEVVDSSGKVVASATPRRLKASVKHLRKPRRPEALHATRRAHHRLLLTWTQPGPRERYTYEAIFGETRRPAVALLRPRRSGKRYRVLIRTRSKAQVIRIVVGNGQSAAVSAPTQVRAS